MYRVSPTNASIHNHITIVGPCANLAPQPNNVILYQLISRLTFEAAFLCAELLPRSLSRFVYAKRWLSKSLHLAVLTIMYRNPA